MTVLALDVGGTAIKSGLAAPDGRLWEERECPSEAKLGGPHLVEKVCETIAGYAGYDCIGISSTGQVDAKAGRIVFANENVPHYTGTPLRELVEARFGVPVRVENDVNAAALGEAYYGCAVGVGDFLCLTYGTGIGGAIVINGDVYRGADGVAGEFGHIVTHAGGRPCACGQAGCYEQYGSTTALVRAAKEIDPQLCDGRKIFAAMAAGDGAVRAVVDGWCEEVALGLASLIHVFNPRCLVLGGGIMREPYLYGRLRERLGGLIMESYRGVELRQARLGNSAGLLGVVHLCTAAG